jgi:hypothetical protein
MFSFGIRLSVFDAHLRVEAFAIRVNLRKAKTKAMFCGRN